MPKTFLPLPDHHWLTSMIERTTSKGRGCRHVQEPRRTRHLNLLGLHMSVPPSGPAGTSCPPSRNPEVERLGMRSPARRVSPGAFPRAFCVAVADGPSLGRANPCPPSQVRSLREPRRRISRPRRSGAPKHRARPCAGGYPSVSCGEMPTMRRNGRRASRGQDRPRPSHARRQPKPTRSPAYGERSRSCWDSGVERRRRRPRRRSARPRRSVAISAAPGLEATWKTLPPRKRRSGHAAPTPTLRRFRRSPFTSRPPGARRRRASARIGRSRTWAKATLPATGWRGRRTTPGTAFERRPRHTTASGSEDEDMDPA